MGELDKIRMEQYTLDEKIAANKLRHTLVPLQYSAGFIDEEEYKKYLLSEDPYYFPPLNKKINGED